MKYLKRGKLYWFQLDCPDIDKFFLKRLFGRLGIDYIPFSLRFYDLLFLREDHSKYSRKLITFCRRQGITTYVVQEGANTLNPSGHLPLYADYFLSLEESKDFWINNGMPIDRIKTYRPQKKKEFYKGIVFLLPLYTTQDFLHPYFWNGTNIKVMRVICDFLKEDVVFKVHPKNAEIVKRFIPSYRLIEGNANDLILKYDKVYCFKNCSILTDCRVLGKKVTVLDEEEKEKK